jgi:AraC family transcriptional activator of pobA
MIYTGNTSEHLHLETVDSNNMEILTETKEKSLSILWFKSGINELIIDGEQRVFEKNQVVYLTEFHRIKIIRIGEINFLKFNQAFYCVQDNDIEVACKGMLFFGASELPVIKIPNEQIENFETLWKIFSIEMQSNDHLQLSMLQMMLRRYLILSTRIFKRQANFPKEKIDSDVIREFNFLVENNFKEKHNLAEYAELMHKSSKTISNIFSKIGSKSPSQYIQERKMLEARRLLQSSDMQIKEIAYEVGYEDIQTFSRFFKNKEGISPSKFKESHH